MNKPDLSQFSEDTVRLVMGFSYMSERFMSCAVVDPNVQQHIIRVGMNDPHINLKTPLPSFDSIIFMVEKSLLTP